MESTQVSLAAVVRLQIAEILRIVEPNDYFKGLWEKIVEANSVSATLFSNVTTRRYWLTGIPQSFSMGAHRSRNVYLGFDCDEDPELPAGA